MWVLLLSLLFQSIGINFDFNVSVFTVLKIKSRDPSRSSHFLVQAVQLISMLPYSESEFEKYMFIAANGKASETFPVIVSSLNFVKYFKGNNYQTSNSGCGLCVV